MAMVRIARYINIIQAQLHAGAIKAEGIPAHVDGVNSSVNVGFAIDAGGIGLWVPNEAAQEAKQIIDALRPIEADEQRDQDDDGDAL